ncbi:chemotaxis protein CheW, partial [Paracoccus sp. (in: a-proteobacteria)]|uniref:chemotaxis protein CheW n=1 Tax=Paracoccus sp. TaxID=267 RepID=UPI00272A44C7
HLTVAQTDEAAPETEDQADRWAQLNAGVDLSAETLERIGEIAAGQAMIHGIIAELAETPLPEMIAQTMRQHHDDPRQALAALRATAEQMMARLRDLAQAETQVLSQMTELQQTTAELRSRPVETLLRPFAAMVATESRQRGREARLTTAGDGLSLDVALLDTLKRVLRPLVQARLGDLDDAPRRMHLSVRRGDDLLLVTLEDDGGTRSEPARLAQAETELTRAGGQLRCVTLPGGGLRHHISLPMNLIVLEGMVVGAGGTRYVLPVAAIRTILQPDPANLVEVSATGGSRWLRLGQDEVVAIRSLNPASEERAAAGEGTTRVHIILSHEEGSVAIPVDELIGQQLVLLRPLRGMMSRVRKVSGVALLAGGDVGMVLSPRALLNLRQGGAETAMAHA